MTVSIVPTDRQPCICSFLFSAVPSISSPTLPCPCKAIKLAFEKPDVEKLEEMERDTLKKIKKIDRLKGKNIRDFEHGDTYIRPRPN
jgi:hypothetical protein